MNNSDGPIRIQRKRTKGWRMPEGAVYVGRGSRWGNPWKVAICQTIPSLSITAEIAVSSYRGLLKARQDDLDASGRKFPGLPYYDEIREALHGKSLACWCAVGQPCHADVLLELANASVTSSPEQEEGV